MSNFMDGWDPPTEVPEHLRVYRIDGKKLDSPFFTGEGEIWDVSKYDVHDMGVFLEMRKYWFGFTAIVRICGVYTDPTTYLYQCLGLETLPPLDLFGVKCMDMGSFAESFVIAQACSLLGITQLEGSRFYHIKDTAVVGTPDDVLLKEHAGPMLEHFFEGNSPQSKPIETKCHFKKHLPPQMNAGAVIQIALQSFALLSNTVDAPFEELVDTYELGGFLFDSHPFTESLQVWHISFPDKTFITNLLWIAEEFRLCLTIQDHPVPTARLPWGSVVYERIV